MHNQKMKIMTGTMLSLLLSAATVCPALARPVVEPESKQSQTEEEVKNTTKAKGTIQSISGNVVTLKMSDGMTQTVTLKQEDVTRLELEPGMEISFMLDDNKMASEVSVVQASTTATDSSGVDATTNREVTTQRRTTVGNTQTPTMDSTTTPTTSSTTEVTETTETQETQSTTTETQEVEETQSTESTPVRALW